MANEILLCGGAVLQGVERAVDEGGEDLVVTLENVGTVLVPKGNIAKIDILIETEEEPDE
ncbi:MAG TPA: hypothetical protein ENI19_01130 [Candidatus Nealsonbacteria bacterium]|uniref:Uncharacterized protein n=1 Tax=marine sediment metagenome TaxID=412755 RepID=A0A0F9YE36_9ZZZZ|nr:hypothetical protein [Candidatus Nealsonbacteria bacterium]HEB46296.1 hypothetical protein [Candidatus Nealsonbacteria bacterium]